MALLGGVEEDWVNQVPHLVFGEVLRDSEGGKLVGFVSLIGEQVLIEERVVLQAHLGVGPGAAVEPKVVPDLPEPGAGVALCSLDEHIDMR